jgi:uncharacterized protein YacL
MGKVEVMQVSEDDKRAQEVFVAANVQANEFARTGLASLLLLNGGAIVALAPIGSLFTITVADHKLAVIFTLFAFVIGLLCALIGYLMGFFVNSELSAMMQYQLGRYSAAEIEATRLRHNKLRLIGIIAAIGGIVCFVAGCLISAAILLNWL